MKRNRKWKNPTQSFRETNEAHIRVAKVKVKL